MPLLAEFLEQLLVDGQVVFQAPPAAEDDPDAAELLRKAFAGYRLTVGGPLLECRPATALAAAEVVRQACWFVVHHGEEPQELARRLALPPPQTAADHLTGDLLLRYLPQVYRRARALAADDPLVEHLARILRHWPLSGVLADLDGPPLTPPDFDDHPGLQLLYAERLAEHPKPGWALDGNGKEVMELIFQERGVKHPRINTNEHE